MIDGSMRSCDICGKGCFFVDANKEVTEMEECDCKLKVPNEVLENYKKLGYISGVQLGKTNLMDNVLKQFREANTSETKISKRDKNSLDIDGGIPDFYYGLNCNFKECEKPIEFEFTIRSDKIEVVREVTDKMITTLLGVSKDKIEKTYTVYATKQNFYTKVTLTIRF